MASSTSTGTFDITRTTGALAPNRRSMNEVRMPAATETGRALEPLRCHAEDAIILAQTRDEPRLHALELEAQNVEHIGSPLDRLFDPSEHADPQLLDPPRHQRPGAAHGDLGAELGEPPQVRARNA